MNPLKEKYLNEVVPAMQKTLNLENPMQYPKIEKVVVNLDRFGNTSSASVPISVDELARSGKLKKGDLIAMCAFGGGLSSAASLIRW